VEQKAPNELIGGEGHHLLLAAVAVVLVAELHLTIFDVQKTIVGNGDAMSVASDVVEYLLGPGKGGFGRPLYVLIPRTIVLRMRTHFKGSLEFAYPLFFMVLGPTLRRTSALVTEWSQKLWPPRQVKLLTNKRDRLVVSSPEKAGVGVQLPPWPPKSLSFNNLPIIINPIHRAAILVNR
jgi:hypothetical protein